MLLNSNQRESRLLTVLTIQHRAAHSLFDFLVAAQPRPIHPETGMVLLHDILVEAHHYAQVWIYTTHEFKCAHSSSVVQALGDVKVLFSIA